MGIDHSDHCFDVVKVGLIFFVIVSGLNRDALEVAPANGKYQ